MHPGHALALHACQSSPVCIGTARLPWMHWHRTPALDALAPHACRRDALAPHACPWDASAPHACQSSRPHFAACFFLTRWIPAESNSTVNHVKYTDIVNLLLDCNSSRQNTDRNACCCHHFGHRQQGAEKQQSVPHWGGRTRLESQAARSHKRCQQRGRGGLHAVRLDSRRV